MDEKWLWAGRTGLPVDFEEVGGAKESGFAAEHEVATRRDKFLLNVKCELVAMAKIAIYSVV